ncbi:MAG: methanogen output domain 1-containing protein [Rhodobacteraceae bacterium]|nr:methanogen output domain 1-containing protein [Paracoccaceae bacterium]
MTTFQDQDFERFNDRSDFAISLLANLSDMFVAMDSVSATEDAIAYAGRLFARELTERLMEQNGDEPLDHKDLAEAMVEMKRRIGGEFDIVSADPEKIVLRARVCPFGKRVVGRPQLCTMTKQVFAQMAEDHVGHGQVDIPKSIARGDRACEVVINLVPQKRRSGTQQPDEMVGVY